MMVPDQLGYLAQERMKELEKEIRKRQLLAALPPHSSLHSSPRSSAWRQWAGSVMVWFGTWLLRWGERMAQCECREKSVSLAS